MAFAQCTYRESQGHRDLSESCGRKVHHMGIRGKISRDTLTPENFIWAILSESNSIRRGERCQFPSFFPLPRQMVNSNMYNPPLSRSMA